MWLGAIPVLPAPKSNPLSLVGSGVSTASTDFAPDLATIPYGRILNERPGPRNSESTTLSVLCAEDLNPLNL